MEGKTNLASLTPLSTLTSKNQPVGVRDLVERFALEDSEVVSENLDPGMLPDQFFANLP